MDLLYIIILACAISMDGFFVGVTYGIRKIKVRFVPLCIISVVSSVMIMLSMVLGNTLFNLISPWVAKIIGSAILIGVGVMVINETYKTIRLQKEVSEGYSIIYADDRNKFPQEIISWKLKPFGLIIQILKEPTKADFDFSGTISCFEAIFLGLALALDALGAGFGAGLTGFNPILIPIFVGAANFIFVSSGNLLGGRFQNMLNSRTAYLPGLILICLGVIELL